MGATVDPKLVTVLEDAQRLGFLGSRPIADVIEHARGFVRALDEFDGINSVLDLGSGGGIPGLVIAHDRPTMAVTLLDRRAKRTDFLERVVRRLGWQHRISVVCQDVSTFGPDASFDAVTARGFGPPEFTLSSASRLVRPGAPIVISEPPGEDRWSDDLLERLQLRRVDDRPVGDRGGDDQRGPAPMVDSERPSLDGLVAVFTTR